MSSLIGTFRKLEMATILKQSAVLKRVDGAVDAFVGRNL